MADGTLKVGTITTSSGSGTITLGQSGETVDMANGTITLNSSMQNTPAFYARASTDQTISNNTTTTVVFDFENFDTNNAFASNTFTVPSGEAGKYFFYTNVTYINPNSTGYRNLYFYKNSTQYIELQRETDDTTRNNLNLSTIMDLSVGDTVTARVIQTSGTDMTLNRIGGTDKNGIHFGGYKLIGA